MRPVCKAASALLAIGMFHAAGAVAAEEGRLSIGVSGGTLGISPEIGYRFGAHGGLRLNGGFYDYDHNEEIDDIDYDGTLKLNSVGLLADWYPMGGSFRISVGARANSNKIDLLATPTGSEQIGDQVFTPAQIGTVTGRVKFNSFTPSLTLGWGGKLARGFTLGFEAGVLLQGSPELGLSASGGTLSNDPTFLAELEQERAQAEEDAEDFKFWPVVQVHFTYRF